MKYKTKINHVGAETPQFPLMARSITRGHVVHFTSDRVGTVVFEGDSDQMLFHECKSWMSCFDDKHWMILPRGTKVTIELTQGEDEELTQ